MPKVEFGFLSLVVYNMVFDMASADGLPSITALDPFTILIDMAAIGDKPV